MERLARDKQSNLLWPSVRCCENDPTSFIKSKTLVILCNNINGAVSLPNLIADRVGWRCHLCLRFIMNKYWLILRLKGNLLIYCLHCKEADSTTGPFNYPAYNSSALTIVLTTMALWASFFFLGKKFLKYLLFIEQGSLMNASVAIMRTLHFCNFKCANKLDKLSLTSLSSQI
jgi:hypothetical protein